MHSKVKTSTHARHSPLVFWETAVVAGQVTARSSHSCAAFHRRERAVVARAHSVCASVSEASVMRSPNESPTAHARPENLIGRPHTRMLLNMYLQARHSSQPARALRPTAYQKVSRTRADLRHRQNQDFQQSGASNLFVVASVNRRTRKRGLRPLLERGRAHGSSALVGTYGDPNLTIQVYRLATRACGPGNPFKTAFRFEKE